jgi:hypothetical protein
MRVVDRVQIFDTEMGYHFVRVHPDLNYIGGDRSSFAPLRAESSMIS